MTPAPDALSQAVMAGDAALLSQLLEAGADPRLPNGEGETPLMLAVYHRRAACVQALAPVSDIHATAWGEGSGAIHFAIANGDDQSLALLISPSLDPSRAPGPLSNYANFANVQGRRRMKLFIEAAGRALAERAAISAIDHGGSTRSAPRL